MGDEIKVTLDLDFKNAVKNIEQFSKQGSAALTGLGKTIGTVKGLVVGLAGAFAFGKIVSEANKADEAVAQLGISLKLAGDYSEQAMQEMEGFSMMLQKTTGFAGGLAQESLALAKNFGLSNEASKRLVKTATDLARVTGGSLAEATNQLIATYSGQAKGLAKLFPSLKNYNELQLKTGAAISVIASRIGGAAAALQNTFGGALNNAKNSFSDFLTVIGQFITRNPLMIAMVKEFASGLDALTSYLANNRDSITKFINQLMIGIVKAVPAVVSGLQIIIGALGGIVKLAAMATIGVVELLRALMGFKVFQILAQGLIRGFSLLVAAILEITQAILSIPAIGKTLKIAGFDVEGARKSLQALTLDTLEFAVNTNADSINASLESIGTTAASAMDKVDSVVGSIGNGLNVVKTRSEQLAESLREIGNRTSDALKDSLSDIKMIAREIESVTSELVKTIRNTGTQNPATALLGMFKKGDLADEVVDVNGTMKRGAMGALFQGVGLGVGNAALSGRDGAKSLLSNSAGTFADAFAPGTGAFVTNFANALMAGPERREELEQTKQQISAMDKIISSLESAATIRPLSMAEQSQLESSKSRKQELDELAKQIEESNKQTLTYQVREFVKALPELIKAIPPVLKDLFKELPMLLVDAIPDLIESLIEAIPDVIEGLVEAWPKLLEASARVMPKLIEAQVRVIGNMLGRVFSEGTMKFLQDIGNFFADLPQKIADAVAGAVSDAFGGGVMLGGEGNKGGFENAIGVDLPGYFAKGGIVPPGFPDDKYPAMLTSDEMVLPPPVAHKFQDYMDTMSEADRPQSAGDMKRLIDLLERSLLGDRNTTISIDGKEFANVIYGLNRKGWRTS